MIGGAIELEVGYSGQEARRSAAPGPGQLCRPPELATRFRPWTRLQGAQPAREPKAI